RVLESRGDVAGGGAKLRSFPARLRLNTPGAVSFCRRALPLSRPDRLPGPGPPGRGGLGHPGAPPRPPGSRRLVRARRAAAAPRARAETTGVGKWRPHPTRLDRQVATPVDTEATAAAGRANGRELQRQRSRVEARLTELASTLAARHVYDRQRVQKQLPA